MIPDNDAGNESNEISACDHHHVRLGVIWGYWVSSDKWHNVSSRNIPGSKLMREITVSGFIHFCQLLKSWIPDKTIAESSFDL